MLYVNFIHNLYYIGFHIKLGSYVPCKQRPMKDQEYSFY